MGEEKSAIEYFPFDSFRENQKEVIEQIVAEFDKGTEVIVVEGPTGFGKSPVNIALGRYYAPTYYTTPQKTLREQLGKDFGGSKLAIDGGESDIVTLKARKDYVCRSSNEDCEICEHRREDELKCSKNPKCTYWIQKEAIFKSEVGVLTFSNLVVNSYIPTFTAGRKCPSCGSTKIVNIDGDYQCMVCKRSGYKNDFQSCEVQVSFEHRNLLIVDECHSLEGQVASLHAGFRITPYKFPKDIVIVPNSNKKASLQELMWSEIVECFPITKASYVEFDRCKAFLDKTVEVINEYMADENYEHIFKDPEIEEKMKNLLTKIDFLYSEVDEGRIWVVNVEYLKSWDCKVPHFKPIKVDNFLQKHIWFYADKILLTSATIPYRNKIGKWLNRIGLGGKKFKLITVPMTFPVEHRPIYLDKMGGSLSYKNKDESWSGCIMNVKEILDSHRGQRGVIHVSSYQMMWDLFKTLKGKYSIFLHNKEELKGNDVIKEWSKSGKEILISPSIFEGVDLKDDLCRFQVLFKVPYANLKDGRVNQLLYRMKDGEWYNNETMIKIIQAYGRAVRSKDDYADFYIIDGDFLPFYNRVVFPEWFKEAIKK